MKVAAHDFRQPGRLPLEFEQALSAWLRAAGGRAAEKWAPALPFALTLAFKKVESTRPSTALARIPSGVLACRIGLGPAQIPTLLLLPSALVLAIVAGMLGDAGTELPPPRALTSVEESLFDYFVQDLLLPSLAETWSGREPLSMRFLDKEPEPRYTRLFGPEGNVVICSLAAEGPFGAQECSWIVPQDSLFELLLSCLERKRPGTKSAPDGSQIETLVRQLPVEMCVELGRVELPFSQLSRLREGDLVILDQRVTEPLAASVAGGKRFQVWPGRTGTQQAVRIASSIEE